MQLYRYLLLGLFVAASIMSSTEADSTMRVASVTWDGTNGRFQLHDSNQTYNSIAWAVFTDHRNTTGWSSIVVHTNEFYLDDQQAFAAGLVEGRLTRTLIQEQFTNEFNKYCEEDPRFCAELFKYLHANIESMVANVAEYSSTDPYWHQGPSQELSKNALRLGSRGRIHAAKNRRTLPESFSSACFIVKLAATLRAKRACRRTTFVRLASRSISWRGCRCPCRETPTLFTWATTWCLLCLSGCRLLNLHGDLSDLETKFNRTNSRKNNPTGSGSCSAIVKLAPGNMDVYFAHATWTHYNSMNRILKKYRLNYHSAPMSKDLIPGSSIVFSGYPARIFSGDDFYLINTGLAVMETTIGNENSDLWKKVTPIDTVPTSIRNMVANRLSLTGQQWTNTFARFNSGTYNNQWMVLDYKLFESASQKLNGGFLWILEQIPGLVMSKDVTPILEEQGYWASYNSPYFTEIFNESGLPALVEKYGDWYTYDKSPRALMFKRDEEKAVDLRSVMKLMRYNDFTNDPLSRCTGCDPPYSAENAISARSDLNPANGTYPFKALGRRAHGGTDAKVTNFALFERQVFYAVSGPTSDDQRPFRWSTSGFDNVSHAGHPDLWDFDPILAQWRY
ncbi:putative phospholipase B-like 2 isoform X1 [Ixodes scapularis]|uniref:putative phospholipase B-like 2 isoform X1 n=1 Tax=Ixodes scapularis TaxID=6945 RepID=UPI001A9D81BF|nr:putative phospholipase B-like 2 isoform X1 [Ixodes scapularis]